MTRVCDVRRNPISRKKGFSKGPLRLGLTEAGIQYEHLPELGIAAERRKNLATPAAREALFAEYERDDLPRQTKALERIAAWAKKERVALLCFERDPADCHRSRVAAALQADIEDL